MSSPGAGKTTLIQQLLEHTQFRAAAVVSDLATDCDAQKIRQAGTPAIQITTGNLCHLEAQSVAKAAQKLDLATLDLLMEKTTPSSIPLCLSLPTLWSLAKAIWRQPLTLTVTRQ